MSDFGGKIWKNEVKYYNLKMEEIIYICIYIYMHVTHICILYIYVFRKREGG